MTLGNSLPELALVESSGLDTRTTNDIWPWFDFIKCAANWLLVDEIQVVKIVPVPLDQQIVQAVDPWCRGCVAM